MHLSRIALSIVLVSSMVVTGCSKQEKAPSAPQQNPPAASQPTPTQETAPGQAKNASGASAGQETNGPRATEKYVLDLTGVAAIPPLVAR